jgi:hypothetical protein
MSITNIRGSSCRLGPGLPSAPDLQSCSGSNICGKGAMSVTTTILPSLSKWLVVLYHFLEL